MDAAEGEALAIEVAYGAEEVQRVAVITVAKGTTIRAAIERSGLLAEFAEIDLAQNPVGCSVAFVSWMTLSWRATAWRFTGPY